MKETRLVTVFFFALLMVLLYFAYLIVSPFLRPIAWAAILAVVVYPAHMRLVRLLRGRATVSALIVTLFILFLVLAPALRLAGFLAEEAIEFSKLARSFVEEDRVKEWQGSPWVMELARLWDLSSAHLESFNIDLKKVTLEGIQKTSGLLVSQATAVVQNVFTLPLHVIIWLFTFFFFLKDGKELCERVRSLLPMSEADQASLFDRIVNAVFAVVHGSIITAMVQGLLAGLGYWALGVPFALLLGVATSFTALFPIGGATLIWLPACGYLFVQGAYMKGAILLIWGIGIVSGIDNVLKPLLIGNRLRLPVLFLFFSILGGLAAFGILGLILGPVIFALLAALLDLYVKEYMKA